MEEIRELDNCPEQAETINQHNDFDGSPDVIPEAFKALIGNQKAIQFELMSAALKTSSELKLNELKQIIAISSTCFILSKPESNCHQTRLVMASKRAAQRTSLAGALRVLHQIHRRQRARITF